MTLATKICTIAVRVWKFIKSIFSKKNHSEELLAASCRGDAMTVKYLISKSVDPSIYNNQAIRLATANGHYLIVKLLIAHYKVDASAMNNQAYRCAIRFNHEKIINLLLTDNRVVKLIPRRIVRFRTDCKN